MFQHGEVRLSFAEIERILGFSLPPLGLRSSTLVVEHPGRAFAGGSLAGCRLEDGRAGSRRAAGRLRPRRRVSPSWPAWPRSGAVFRARRGGTHRGLSADALSARARADDRRPCRRQHGGDRTSACLALLDQLANDRLAAMVEWFQKAFAALHRGYRRADPRRSRRAVKPAMTDEVVLDASVGGRSASSHGLRSLAAWAFFQVRFRAVDRAGPDLRRIRLGRRPSSFGAGTGLRRRSRAKPSSNCRC